MDDEKILSRGGTGKDIEEYAKQNGADLTEDDVGEDSCPKCGGNMSSRMAGDESYRRCGDCGYLDMS